MNWSAGLAWLAALATRREARGTPIDHADMGTAFGLDASLVPAYESGQDAGPASDRRSRQPFERRVVRRFDR